MVHMASKAKKQLKKIAPMRIGVSVSTTSCWNQKWAKNTNDSLTKDKSREYKDFKLFEVSNKGKEVVQAIRSRDVTCFKCLRKRHIVSQCSNCNTIIMQDNGKIECFGVSCVR